jgi:LPXTG-site transpeptidase (sortase) family protein
MLLPSNVVHAGPVRLIAGVVLAFVLVGCGSDTLKTSTASPAATEAPAATPTASAPAPTTDAPEAHSSMPDEKRGEPHALRIPRLRINAPIVPVKMQDRVLNPPKDPNIVGWWSEGAAPGDDIGSALVVGHTVNTGGGVFDDVDKLQPGDTVQIDNSGGRLNYRIDSVEVLPKDEVARQADTLFDQTVHGRLVLVSCEDWDGKVYRSNVIAVAVR